MDSHFKNVAAIASQIPVHPTEEGRLMAFKLALQAMMTGQMDTAGVLMAMSQGVDPADAGLVYGEMLGRRGTQALRRMARLQAGATAQEVLQGWDKIV